VQGHLLEVPDAARQIPSRFCLIRTAPPPSRIHSDSVPPGSAASPRRSQMPLRLS